MISWVRGLYQSIVLAVACVSVGGTLLKWAVENSNWGPLIGIGFGCCAVSIAVQQAYAWSTEGARRNEKAVYLWSSVTLFLLGIATILGSLPNFGELDFAYSVQRGLFVWSAAFFILGFIALFRFFATYLYRGSDFLSQGYYTVFRWLSKPKSRWLIRVELAHLVYCAICGGALLFWFFFDESPEVPQDKPISTQDKAANPVYFPFRNYVKVFLGSALGATAICATTFFWHKFLRVRDKNESINGNGIRVMIVLSILFFVPTLLQLAALAPRVVGFEWRPEMVAGILAFFLFIGTGLGAVAYSQEMEKVSARSINRAACLGFTLSLFLCAILIVFPRLLQTLPLGFVMLGFLTLGCAYLPIYDLEQSRLAALQQRS